MDINVSEWKNRIEQAESLQEQEHSRWQESLLFVSANWDMAMQAGSGQDPDFTAVNYATNYYTILTSAIYSRNPYIWAKASHGKFAGFASSMEMAVNYLWRELD